MRRPPWLTTLYLAAVGFVFVSVIFYYFDAPWNALISACLVLAALVTNRLIRRRRAGHSSRRPNSGQSEPIVSRRR